MSEPHEPDITPMMSTEAPLPEAVRPSGITVIEAGQLREVRVAMPWWPFLMYLGVWIGSMGAAGWLFIGLPGGSTLYGSDPYAYMVLGGVGLTLIGPALTLGTWLVLYVRAEPDRRTGLLSGSLVRGALVTLAGVAVWWGMLIVVDVLRLGRPW